MKSIISFFTNMNEETGLNLIIAFVIVAVLRLLSPLFSYAIIKIFNLHKSEEKIKNNAFYIPLRSFFRILGIYSAIMFLRPTLNFSNDTLDIITKIFKIAVILTTAAGLSKSLTKNSRLVRKFREKSERDMDDTSINFLLRVIRALIYIIAGFMIMADLGYDLSGLITGLGLGSVVVSLAAQDTIKNLFGGIIIFLDKPFKVGDYIKFNTYEGTVEDITFRSTRVRTIENSIAQIPNSEISSTTVVNLSKIEKRRYNLDLGLVLDTNLSKIEGLKQEILEYLDNRKTVLPNSANVFFTEIKSNEFNVSIYCYLNTVEYIEFLEEKEIINYKIMEIVHKNNVELAYDTKTIEIKKAWGFHKKFIFIRYNVNI